MVVNLVAPAAVDAKELVLAEAIPLPTPPGVGEDFRS